MKNIIKDTIFIIIFLVLFNICSNIFILKGNGYGSDVTSFYNLEKDSLDIIFFGSSHSYATFSPYIIEEEIGLKSYNFATQQQPIHITYHYMIESLKTQHPKYFVLESYMLNIDGYGAEGTNRDAIDKMHMSINKIKTINESVPDKNDRTSYYINLIKYHSRYNELTKNDIKEGLLQKGINNLGFISLKENSDVVFDNREILKIKDKEEISEKNLEYLNKIVELTKKENIKLILVISPFDLKEEYIKKINWLKDYALKNNIEFINYNELSNDLNLEINDFYDHGHLSGTGATKVSKHFANYLKENPLQN